MLLTAIDFPKLAARALAANEESVKTGMAQRAGKVGVPDDTYEEIVDILTDTYVAEDTFEAAFYYIASLTGTYAATDLFSEFVPEDDVKRWAKWYDAPAVV